VVSVDGDPVVRDLAHARLCARRQPHLIAHLATQQDVSVVNFPR
jgi:hypothetical protein